MLAILIFLIHRWKTIIHWASETPPPEKMHSKKCRSAVFVILHPKGVPMRHWHITLPIRGHMIRFHATATPSNCRNKGEMSAIWFTKRIAQKTNPCNKPLRMYMMELSYDHQIKKHNHTTVLLQAVITLSYSALTHSFCFGSRGIDTLL